MSIQIPDPQGIGEQPRFRPVVGFWLLVLYGLGVTIVAVRSVPIDSLAVSDAPVSLMFETSAGMSPLAITLIAILATVNGIIMFLIMASRVVYGLTRNRRLPCRLGAVSTRKCSLQRDIEGHSRRCASGGPGPASSTCFVFMQNFEEFARFVNWVVLTKGIERTR